MSHPVESAEPQVATFAGGCFWCIESGFDHHDGVIKAVSGYMGGDSKNPSYEQVSSGQTGHLEVVQISYDPSKISFKELLESFWIMIDPTDGTGSFFDRGSQYAPAIFYHTEEQKNLAEASKAQLEGSGRFQKSIATAIRAADTFYPAEEYHQDYYTKEPQHYKRYRTGSGRDRFCARTWGRAPFADDKKWQKPDPEALKAKLDKIQYHVTQNDATERAFDNAYWDHKKAGIFVDVVSGEPLFCSLDKFDSGTGWPSFTRPLEAWHVVEIKDQSHGMTRIEVRSRFGDSHLGHLFDDGPAPTGLRYCINSASLRFIAVEDLEREGYGSYQKVFE